MSRGQPRRQHRARTLSRSAGRLPRRAPVGRRPRADAPRGGDPRFRTPVVAPRRRQGAGGRRPLRALVHPLLPAAQRADRSAGGAARRPDAGQAAAAAPPPARASTFRPPPGPAGLADACGVTRVRAAATAAAALLLPVCLVAASCVAAIGPVPGRRPAGRPSRLRAGTRRCGSGQPGRPAGASPRARPPSPATPRHDPRQPRRRRRHCARKPSPAPVDRVQRLRRQRTRRTHRRPLCGCAGVTVASIGNLNPAPHAATVDTDRLLPARRIAGQAQTLALLSDAAADRAGADRLAADAGTLVLVLTDANLRP